MILYFLQIRLTVGIYLGDNKMFHAGDPIGYADLTGRYWRQHFVCCGRYN